MNYPFLGMPLFSFTCYILLPLQQFSTIRNKIIKLCLQKHCAQY
jgi:hypothetical protein